MTSNTHPVDTDDGKRISLRLYESAPDEEKVIQAYNKQPPHRRSEWLRRIMIAGYAALYKGVLATPEAESAPAPAPAQRPQESAETTESAGATAAATPTDSSATAAFLSGVMGDNQS